MDLPEILTEENVKKAATLLHRYYLVPDGKKRRLSTGSYFDEWAGRGDTPGGKDRISDSDLVAVSMLSIKVPATAAIGLLEPEKNKAITNFLADIPTDVELHTLNSQEFQDLLGDNSPAWKLWYALLNQNSKWGIGPTTASKILHRKRPHMIPIWDDVIGQLIVRDSPKDQWKNWHELLSDGTGLPDRLDRIHELSEVPIKLSKARIMDVVLWRHGRDLGFRGGRARQHLPVG